MTFDRTRLRYALAVLWLLDAALQFQPFMFTRSFGTDILRPSADGQPAAVAAPTHAAASLVAGHPLLLNSLFAVIQLLIAVALIPRRTARLALTASIGWSAAVWWLGEGLGGLLSGHAMLLTGAPGAVALYGLLAVAAWPRRDALATARPISGRLVATSWAALWLGGAVFQLLPGQNTGSNLSAAIRGAADGAPGWLTHLDILLAAHIPSAVAFAVALAAVQAMVGIAVLVPGFTRTSALITGGGLTVAYWLFGQSLGEISTGQATDPNTAPLVLLLGVAVVASSPRRGGTLTPVVAPHSVPPRRISRLAARRAARVLMRTAGQVPANTGAGPVTVAGRKGPKMGRTITRRTRVLTAGIAAVITAGVGVAVASTAAKTPSNAVHAGKGIDEFGMTKSFFAGHTVSFTYTKGFYCDKHVSSAATSGCEAGKNYKKPPAQNFDPLYITVPLGFNVPAMSMECPTGLVCVDHPGTIDLSRLEPALKPLYPNLTKAQLTAALKNYATPGHEHFITTRDGGRKEWWDVKVVGVTSQTEWNKINAHKSFHYLHTQVKKGKTTGIIPTNLFLFFAVK